MKSMIDQSQQKADGASNSKPIPILNQLEHNINHLPDALARIAKYIVENPEKVINHSLTDVSHFARSGSASVIRLCKDIGFNGFKEFKISLAGELARQTTSAVDSQYGNPNSYDHITRALCKSITGTSELVDPVQMQWLMQKLKKCVRIDLYGAAVSGIAAEIVAYRLLRVGLNAHAIRDANLAHEIANGLGPGTAAIAISESGVTPDAIDFLKSAKSAGAFSVALSCRSKSPLSDYADVVIPMTGASPPSYSGHVTGVPRAVLIAEIMAETLTALDT